MIVGVSMRVIDAQGYSEPRDAVSHALLCLIRDLGGIPLLIPNAVDPRPYIERFRPERLVLSGGEDIVSDVAGPMASILDVRDRAERLIVDDAVVAGIPLLGICRGAMFLNLRFGGGLTKDLATATGENHVARSHELRLWDGRRATTNSFHNHGLLASQLAPGMELLASTPGGTVEAFRRASPRLLGLLWHPERPGSANDLDRELISAWLQ